MDDPAFHMMRLKREGYCCSLLIMALEVEGKTNTDLIRAVRDLCLGVAMSGEICAALAGGACVVSLYTGKGFETEETDERLPQMMSDPTEWF
ncbi:MAG: C-GCAxxG-C-C family protein [Syntrophorhabdales bacterium]|jgi:hypothetical protein